MSHYPSKDISKVPWSSYDDMNMRKMNNNNNKNKTIWRTRTRKKGRWRSKANLRMEKNYDCRAR